MTTFTSSLRRVGAALFVLSSFAFSSAAFGFGVNIIDDPTIFNDCVPSNTEAMRKVFDNQLNSNARYFEATFDDMNFDLVNRWGKRRGSKDCIMEFEIEVPEGYTIDVLSLHLAGSMKLPKDAEGSAEVIVSIPGLTNKPWNNSKSVKIDMAGPVAEADEAFSEYFQMNFSSLPGQLCPTKIKVYVDVLLRGKMLRSAPRNSKAAIKLDHFSGQFKTAKGASLWGTSVVKCEKAKSNDYPYWW